MSLYICYYSFFLLTLFIHPSHSKTIIIRGHSGWQNHTIYIGDTLVFKGKHLQSLFIFHSGSSFKSCNFTQAAHLNVDNNSTSFKWHPSHVGYFYFTSRRSCEVGEKIVIIVNPKPFMGGPALPPAIPPEAASGGEFSSHPLHIVPSKSPIPIVPRPDSAIPFITSNPAIPLPKGEADSATVRPKPASGGGCKVVVGLLWISKQMMLMACVMVPWLV
ncbi:hypothetical protein QJS10_CPB13g01377 [Acorus calamus]|uniref:Uncharacterized protein n=1 Tax=Acorus calamus TaxID=4465 RepID=A0AAV9DI64_ACOCL|nr:hypothetical protein QJS10_CPB13g01377 [Acorus calamus]